MTFTNEQNLYFNLAKQFIYRTNLKTYKKDLEIRIKKIQKYQEMDISSYSIYHPYSSTFSLKPHLPV